MSIISRLPEWVKPGASYRYDFGPDNENTGRKFQIRAIVDDQIIVREWWKGKQSWNYEIQSPYHFLGGFVEHMTPCK